MVSMSSRGVSRTFVTKNVVGSDKISRARFKVASANEKLVRNPSLLCILGPFAYFSLRNTRPEQFEAPASTAQLHRLQNGSTPLPFATKQQALLLSQQRQNDVSTSCAFEPPRPGERCVVGRNCLYVPPIGKGKSQRKNLCVSASISFSFV